MDATLHVSQHRALGAKAASGALGCSRDLSAAGRGGPADPLSSGEAAPGALCPLLGSSGQEGDGATGEGPVKGHEDGEGTGAPLL